MRQLDDGAVNDGHGIVSDINVYCYLNQRLEAVRVAEGL